MEDRDKGREAGREEGRKFAKEQKRERRRGRKKRERRKRRNKWKEIIECTHINVELIPDQSKACLLLSIFFPCGSGVPTLKHHYHLLQGNSILCFSLL